MRFTPWDQGDPRLDAALNKCITDNYTSAETNKKFENLKQKIIALKLAKADAEAAAAQKEGDKILSAAGDKCREMHADRLSNASNFAVGVAPTWTSKNGNLGDLNSSGAAFWTSFTYDFSTKDDNGNFTFFPGFKGAQLILHARYRTDEEVPSDASSGTFFNQDSLLIGGRFRIDGPDALTLSNKLEKLKLSIEGAYVDTDREGLTDDTYYRMALGAEFKIKDGLWFELAGGRNIDRQNDNDTFVMSTLKWGFADIMGK